MQVKLVSYEIRLVFVALTSGRLSTAIPYALIIIEKYVVTLVKPWKLGCYQEVFVKMTF